MGDRNRKTNSKLLMTDEQVNIVNVICREYSATDDIIFSVKSKKYETCARRVAMVLFFQSGTRREMIAHIFGIKSPSAISNAVRKHCEQYRRDLMYRNLFDRVIASIN